MNQSIWQKSLNKDHREIYQTLKQDLECDVLIIGGGLTGLSTLYYLKKAQNDLKVILVERNKVGMGISSRSTAKINYLQDILYKISNKSVDKYLKSQIDAIKLILNIIKENKIKCDLEKTTSFLLANNDKEIKRLNKIKNILNRNGINYNVNDLDDNILHKEDISVLDTYTFNPCLYMNSLYSLMKDNIYENTEINDIKKINNNYYAYTNNHKIKTKKIVMASWYPFFLKPYFFPIKAHLEKSFIASFKSNNPKKITGINLDKKVRSFRFYKDNLIYLTNTNLIYFDKNENNFNNLKRAFNIKPNYIWSNIDIITNDYMPYIGSLNNDNTLLIGTGYNTWGNTNATLAGKILSDIILKKNNEYITVFNPKRTLNIKKIGYNLLNCFYNIMGYLKGCLNKQEGIYYKSKYAIYKKDDQEYKIKKRCTHMKCTLIFNNEEKTWDCPCHASRFDIEGNQIQGPATKSVKIDNNYNN